MGVLSQNHFLLRKLHSLTGVIPVGGFLVFHLFTNSKAAQGAEVYNKAVENIQTLPFLPALEWLFIFIPIYFHAILGIVIFMQARNNITQYPYARNIAFWLQRMTGLLVLVFVTYHIWHFRVAKGLGLIPDVKFNTVVAGLSHPGVRIFYLIGTLAAAFHLANGLWAFLIHWGITTGRRAQKTTWGVAMVIFVLVAVLGVRALMALR